MKLMVLVAVCFICLLPEAADAAEEGTWDYSDGSNGPDKWGDTDTLCNGKKQSPIDIKKMDVKVNTSLPALFTEKYSDSQTGNYTMKNTRTSVTTSLSLDNATQTPIMKYSGKTYMLEQFHFHWGKDNSEGSEHTIDEKKYPAEIHLVHWNMKYGNISAAANKTDGLLVFGFLIDVQETNNTAFDTFLASLKDIPYEDDETNIPYTPITPFLPAVRDGYFTYSGSLTTPGCYESVTWIVSHSPIKMSSEQISMFRNLYSGKNSSSHKIEKNYRPVQELYGRTVSSNKPVNTDFNFLEPTGFDYSTGPIGTANWGKNYYFCDDTRGDAKQSPINIDTSTVKYNASLPEMIRTNYTMEDASKKYKMKNEGYSVKIELPEPNYVEISYKGKAYALSQLHFHSGGSATEGSEHLINDKAHQVEVHFVHWNKAYENIGVAVKKSDGLLVSGYFMQSKDGANHSGYQKLFDHFDKVKYYGNSTDIPYFPAQELIANKTKTYFTYSGSLTTPGCFDSVTWIVNSEIIDISPQQMQKFGMIYDKKMKQLKNNYRSVQKLNGRQVHTNVMPVADSGSANIASLFLVVAALFMYRAL